MKLEKIFEYKDNVAEHLEDELLTEIGNDVVEGYTTDLQSRSNWERDIKKYMKLAMQIVEDKTFPWPGAANVKYPMISTAAMQFSARAYPTLVPSTGNLVNVAITPAISDPNLEKRAQNVARFMSYQLLNDIDGWEEGMDKMLLALAICGIGYKKIYFCPDTGHPASDLINPFNVVVNYWTKDLESAPRISEIIYKTQREVIEKKRAGLYRDVDLGEPQLQEIPQEELNVSRNLTQQTQVDETTPYMLIEQHTYLDLDEDGYTEPYIVLVDYNSKQVLRIVPRFTEDSVTVKDDKIVKIDADNYYVKYSFFPSPDGSFYTRGFGHMLGPLNESVNTILNQLIDAGTMSNMQAGFIGKGLKLRQGDNRFRPGEWKPVNTLGADIKQNIYPLPTREPSNVLFQLLGMMVQSGKELASVAEIFVGKMPGQNTPAYTTQQSIEQGMKLFTAIYKRVYRSLTTEFRMLYRINSLYLDELEYQKITGDETASEADFNISDKAILPAADPSASSEFEKQQKYQQLGNLLNLGTIERMAYTKQLLRSYHLSEKEIEELTANSPATQPPQPSPEQQKAQMDQQASQQKMQLEQAKAALKAREAEFKMALEQQKAQFELKNQAMQAQFDQLKALLDVRASEMKQQQELKQQHEKHQANMQQTREVAAAKAEAARSQQRSKKRTD